MKHLLSVAMLLAIPAGLTAWGLSSTNAEDHDDWHRRHYRSYDDDDDGGGWRWRHHFRDDDDGGRWGDWRRRHHRDWRDDDDDGGWRSRRYRFDWYPYRSGYPYHGSPFDGYYHPYYGDRHRGFDWR